MRTCCAILIAFVLYFSMGAMPAGAQTNVKSKASELVLQWGGELLKSVVTEFTAKLIVDNLPDIVHWSPHPNAQASHPPAILIPPQGAVLPSWKTPTRSFTPAPFSSSLFPKVIAAPTAAPRPHSVPIAIATPTPRPHSVPIALPKAAPYASPQNLTPQLELALQRPEVQNSLGMYAQQTAPDPYRARLWFQNAAYHGYAPAIYNLALIYRDGWGLDESDHLSVVQDLVYSRYLMYSSARLGYAPAMLRMGYYLAYGVGGSIDPDAAATWFDPIARSGDSALAADATSMMNAMCHAGAFSLAVGRFYCSASAP